MNEEMNSDDFYEYWEGMIKTSTLVTTEDYDNYIEIRKRIRDDAKSLGFITLSPAINLTPAGRKLISAKRTEEIFLRQLLKFQIPSPYHKSSEKAAKFFVKPYLEILRLVHKLGTLKFDELEIFRFADYRLQKNLMKSLKK
ncbi:MAG: AlwI family type II restriction endonuclease [Treponema succinifaciens]|nr:MAG: AlwI family type II restriction endonuclease [Treponema succinifaciens]